MTTETAAGRVGRWLRAAVAVALAATALTALALPRPDREVADGRRVVRFWHVWTGEWKEVVDRIVDRFNASQDRWRVVALSMPVSSAEQKFVLAVAGGDPPDAMAHIEQVVPAWASQGLIAPLDDLLPAGERAALAERLYPVALKVATWRERLYAVPIGLNTWACYYRPDALREAGLADRPFPATLEELADWGRRLHRRAPDGRLVRMGFWPTWVTQYAPRFGGGWWDERSGALTLDTEANRRALRFVADWSRELGFDRVVRFQSSLNTGGFATEWPFISGEYAIVMDGQWRVEQLARYAPELAYATAPLPPAAGFSRDAGYAAGNFIAIPRGAREREGAMAFIRFWSGLDQPERAAEFYAWGGWLPIAPAITAAPAYQGYLARYPQLRTFVDILPSPELQTAPPVPYQVWLLDQIRRAEDAAVRGSKTPEGALADLAESVAHEADRRARIGAPR